MPRLAEMLFTLLDPDAERRSAVAAAFAPFVNRLVPRESLDQLMANWPMTGFILVHASGSMVADLQNAMRIRGRWRTHVAYGEVLSADAIVDAVLGGAIDYHGWPIGEDELLDRMQSWPHRSRQTGMRELRKIRARKRVDLLTPRQIQILNLMRFGNNGAQVADELGLSARTVEIHRLNMVKRLGVANSAAAIRMITEAELPTIGAITKAKKS